MIFETHTEHDIQFDVHPSKDKNECIASTFIRNDQIKENKGTST